MEHTLARSHKHTFTINRYFNRFPHRLVHDKYIQTIVSTEKLTFSSLAVNVWRFYLLLLSCLLDVVYFKKTYGSASVRECVRANREWVCTYACSLEWLLFWNVILEKCIVIYNCFFIGHSNRLFFPIFHLNFFRSFSAASSHSQIGWNVLNVVNNFGMFILFK